MGPLDGIRVIDWTIWQQGPVASALLGDLGAEVIKVESRSGGDPSRAYNEVRGAPLAMANGRNAYFEYTNRNKKGIKVDLSKEEGREIIYRLAARSDVFVQNFRRDVASRLGMDYPALSKRNGRLIYASGSGYGPNGPDSNRPAFDALVQARSGMMVQTQPESTPTGASTGICDQAGGIMLAYGVLAALIARERLGKGQEIDISLLGSATTLLGLCFALNLLVGAPASFLRRAAVNPLANHYRCADGRWIIMSHLQSDRYWGPFCKAVGIPHLIDDHRFHTMDARRENAAELVAILDGVFLTRPYGEWEGILRREGDFIFDVVQDLSALAGDPQVIANNYVVEFEHPVLGKIKMPGFPVRLSGTPCSLRLPAPEFGQHTEEVLTQICGYTWDEVNTLADKEVI